MEMCFSDDEYRAITEAISIQINRGRFLKTSHDMGMSYLSSQSVCAYEDLLYKLDTVHPANAKPHSINLTRANLRRIANALFTADYLLSIDSAYKLVFGMTKDELDRMLEYYRMASKGKRALKDYEISMM